MKWIRYYKKIDDELVAEEFTKFGSWGTDGRIYTDFLEWQESKKWDTEKGNTVCDYEEVDIPSVEWLQNNIDANNQTVKSIEKETQEFKEMLYKHSRGYKVDTIIDKIKDNEVV